MSVGEFWADDSRTPDCRRSSAATLLNFAMGGVVLEIFRVFGENTSVLPVAHIYAAVDKKVRILWGVLFVVCFVLFLRDSYVLLRSYYNYDKNTVFTVSSLEVCTASYR